MLFACTASFTMLGSTISHMEQKQETVFVKSFDTPVNAEIIVLTDLNVASFSSTMQINDFNVSLSGKVFNPNSFAIIKDVGWQSYRYSCYIIPYKEKLTAEIIYPDLPDRNSRSNC